MITRSWGEKSSAVQRMFAREKPEAEKSMKNKFVLVACMKENESML